MLRPFVAKLSILAILLHPGFSQAFNAITIPDPLDPDPNQSGTPDPSIAINATSNQNKINTTSNTVPTNNPHQGPTQNIEYTNIAFASPDYSTLVQLGSVNQLMGHMQYVPEDELANVILRGERALGTLCAVKKSDSSNFCKYRLLNYNKTVLCFNNDPFMGVVGVTHGSWKNDPIFKYAPDGSPINSSKDYFNNIRTGLSGYSGAKEKVLAYIKNYLLVPANPCNIAIKDYQKSASIEFDNPSNFSFYKNSVTKEIYCSSKNLKDTVWDPISCNRVQTEQFFDPGWCKKIFAYFSTMSTQSISYNQTIIPVSQVSYSTLTPPVIKEAIIQHLPPAIGLNLEEASTMVSIFDNLDPSVMAMAEYADTDITPVLTSDPDLRTKFQRFYKLVHSAENTPGVSIHIPLSFKKVKTALTSPSHAGLVGQAMAMPIFFDSTQVLNSKRQILRSAGEKIARAINTANFDYSEPFFQENVSCSEQILSVASSTP